MIDLRHDSPAERFAAVRKGRELLVIACCAFLAAPAAASAAKPSSEQPVSPRYQAISCDTAASVGLAGARVAVARPTLARHPRILASFQGFSTQERRSTLFGYQSREAISNSRETVSVAFLPNYVQMASRTCVDTATWIPPTVTGRISPAESRFLLQLAAAFAAAYVLFLAVWFWGTRDRRSRVGSAVRS
jgi:hypothetical protein